LPPAIHSRFLREVMSLPALALSGTSAKRASPLSSSGHARDGSAESGKRMCGFAACLSAYLHHKGLPACSADCCTVDQAMEVRSLPTYLSARRSRMSLMVAIGPPRWDGGIMAFLMLLASSVWAGLARSRASPWMSSTGDPARCLFVPGRQRARMPMPVRRTARAALQVLAPEPAAPRHKHAVPNCMVSA